MVVVLVTVHALLLLYGRRWNFATRNEVEHQRRTLFLREFPQLFVQERTQLAPLDVVACMAAATKPKQDSVKASEVKDHSSASPVARTANALSKAIDKLGGEGP